MSISSDFVLVFLQFAILESMCICVALSHSFSLSLFLSFCLSTYPRLFYALFCHLFFTFSCIFSHLLICCLSVCVSVCMNVCERLICNCLIWGWNSMFDPKWLNCNLKFCFQLNSFSSSFPSFILLCFLLWNWNN